MKLVRINIPARINRIIAVIPLMSCKKNNVAITKATSILATLSNVPMFFFMCLSFCLVIQRKIQTKKNTAQLLLLHKGNFISAHGNHTFFLHLFQQARNYYAGSTKLVGELFVGNVKSAAFGVFAF